MACSLILASVVSLLVAPPPLVSMEDDCRAEARGGWSKTFAVHGYSSCGDEGGGPLGLSNPCRRAAEGMRRRSLPPAGGRMVAAAGAVARGPVEGGSILEAVAEGSRMVAVASRLAAEAAGKLWVEASEPAEGAEVS